MLREIRFYKQFFIDFYFKQNDHVQEKIDFVLDLIRHFPIIPTKFLKKIKGTNDLYEIRVKVNKDIFRIFCFFDNGNIVILLTGFKKKTQKLPQREIERAIKLKKEYLKEKYDSK